MVTLMESVESVEKEAVAEKTVDELAKDLKHKFFRQSKKWTIACGFLDAIFTFEKLCSSVPTAKGAKMSPNGYKPLDVGRHAVVKKAILLFCAEKAIVAPEEDEINRKMQASMATKKSIKAMDRNGQKRRFSGMDHSANTSADESLNLSGNTAII